jgi:plastocyanin
MPKAIIAIIAVVIIGAGGYLVLHKDSDKSSKDSGTQTNQSADTSTQTGADNSANQKVAATITYSNNGFSPATVTVESGDTIAIKNTASRSVQFDSDPHPDHTDDEELNVGIVAPGETATFKVTQTGNHGYHNHLNSSDTGTIIVVNEGGGSL